LFRRITGIGYESKDVTLKADRYFALAGKKYSDSLVKGLEEMYDSGRLSPEDKRKVAIKATRIKSIIAGEVARLQQNNNETLKALSKSTEQYKEE
jgi:predicted HTH domain antitoxin